MKNEFIVCYRGDSVGTVKLEKQGIYTMLSCSCRRFTSAITRLVCENGENEYSIGVMMPQGINMVLGKRLTNADMEHYAINDNASFKLISACDDVKEPAFEIPQKEEEPDGWKNCHDPEKIFEDEELSHACRNASGLLVRQEDNSLLLAVPIRSDVPFPMMPIFCFGRSEKIFGREYIVFTVREGQLVV